MTEEIKSDNDVTVDTLAPVVQNLLDRVALLEDRFVNHEHSADGQRILYKQ